MRCAAGMGRLSLVMAVGLWGVSALAWGQSPSAEQALGLQPVQKDVDIAKPAAADLPKCTIKAEKIGGHTGWVVRDPAGQILRRFLDTNGDNVVDQWCYYDAGIEVYRDIDTNQNNKADQYRWLNTAGTRWGLDTNEDGTIDRWKQISAEEAAAEAVRALATRDEKRFERLLLTSEELGQLGLGKRHTDELTQMLAEAPKTFRASASAGGTKTSLASYSESKWVHFGSSRPGVVPSGTEDSTRDLTVYENVIAMVEAEGKSSQVQIGTLIRVGDLWRIVAAPEPLGDQQTELASSGFFFKTPTAARPEGATADPSENTKYQEALARLEKLDQSINQTTDPAQLATLHAQRADLAEQLANLSDSVEDKSTWIHNLADTVSAAVQQGQYPQGVERLRALQSKLTAANEAELAAYVQFRVLMADYGLKLATQPNDFVKVQQEWLGSLQKYVTDFPKSPDTAEAMMQLAIAYEFAGQEEDAKKWYGGIVAQFPSSSNAQKAAGAKARLESVGKVLQMKGPTIDGRQLDLAELRGKVVLIHYWATWCEPCKLDLAQIKEMQAKYGSSGLAVVGISLDSRPEELQAFLKSTRLSWPQLYEPGGLDNRLANSLGILTLPTMILLDKQGKVANRNIHVSELDREIGALLK